MIEIYVIYVMAIYQFELAIKIHVNTTWAWLDIKSQKSSQLIVEEDKVYKG